MISNMHIMHNKDIDGSDMYRNLRGLDLSLLVALDVLFEELHVSRAANKLSLSQSATSRTLARLRDMFDDPLLLRTAEGMVMTERAKQLKPLVKDCLDGAEKLFMGDNFEPNASTRHFSFSATSYVAQAYLPEVMSKIRLEAPNCTVSLDNLSAVNLNGNDEERVDLIICGDGFNIPQNYKSRHLGRDKMVCIMSNKHPLAKKRSFSVKDYVAYGHCQMSLGTSNTLISVDSHLAALNEKRIVRLKLPHVMACMEMVGKTDLLHTNASNLNRKFLKEFNLTIKELPFDFPNLDYAIYWHPIHHQNPAHIWLRNRCVDEIKLVFKRLQN